MLAYVHFNIDLPWIAWLVYRGEVVTPTAISDVHALSVWHAIYLISMSRGKRHDYYMRELLIEAIRQQKYPRAVSRLSGAYFFKDKDAAHRAINSWAGYFRSEYLAEVEIANDSRISTYDSEWITSDQVQGTEWIDNYLSGKPMSPTPLWEMILDGRALIQTTSVRELAYDRVKSKWPLSLGLLELSRVAVELKSDLGLIVPIISKYGHTHKMSLYLNFRDASNESFLNQFSTFSGPINTADLNVNTDLIVPDLRKYSVTF